MALDHSPRPVPRIRWPTGAKYRIPTFKFTSVPIGMDKAFPRVARTTGRLGPCSARLLCPLLLILVVPLAVDALGLLAEDVQSGELLEVIRVVAHLQHKVKAQLAILITHFTRARGAALERGALRFFSHEERDAKITEFAREDTTSAAPWAAPLRDA